jgi:DNA-binding transcriptional ArsR family regulator
MPRAAVADPFHAVADPTRRAILDRLRGTETPVHELAAGFRMSRPAISKHLRVLREARLVTERKDGREHRYQLNAGPLLEVANWLDGYRRFWQLNLQSLKRHVEGKRARLPEGEGPEGKNQP